MKVVEVKSAFGSSSLQQSVYYGSVMFKPYSNPATFKQFFGYHGRVSMLTHNKRDRCDRL